VTPRPIPLFRSGTGTGYSRDIKNDPRRVIARKRSLEFQVLFTDSPCVVQTAEGPVRARPGDAIVTGTAGERWPVSPARFQTTYRPVPPTVAGQAGTYLSLPNEVMGVPMTEAFDVLLADGISRLHGERGDWLIDYGDGSFGVVSQAIFPGTYEIIG
jgi:hypothetical protein